MNPPWLGYSAPGSKTDPPPPAQGSPAPLWGRKKSLAENKKGEKSIAKVNWPVKSQQQVISKKDKRPKCPSTELPTS